MKKQLLILSAFCVVTGLWSCTKEEENGIKDNNPNPPGLVSNVKVTNENGAATITYSMPADQDLLYVKAMYTLANGTKREVKASTYTNALRVDGFSDTLKHTVQLVAVNKSEVASAPVDVTVEPLVSPIQLVYRNLQVTATAGGIRIKSLNKFRGNVVIVPLMDSLSKGEFIALDNIYTADSIIATSIRGLTPVPKKFAFFVRDRWLNTTDTMYLSLTPAKEVLLPRSGFSSFVCDNDTKMSFNTTVEMMWQGLLNNEWPCTYTDESSGVPTTITWSVGPQPMKLTRFNLLTRREGSFYFAKGSPRRFEVYGANEPTRDGDWSKWTKIQTFEVIKPSGLPLGQETSADAAAGSAGFTFDISEDTPKYRYLRIKCLQNWIGSYFFVVQNMNVWATE